MVSFELTRRALAEEAGNIRAADALREQSIIDRAWERETTLAKMANKE